MVDIGKLNKRITFQRFGTVENSMGYDTGKWQDFKSVWATVKPIKSSESKFMGKVKPEVTHRIYVRYRNDITADMRIIYHGRVLEISAPPIDLDEAHEMLEIQCQEVFEHGRYQH